MRGNSPGRAGLRRRAPLETMPAAAMIAAACVLLVVAAALQARIGAAIGRRDEAARIDRVPPPELLSTLPLLPRRLVADMLWIRALQSYGYHRQTDHDFRPLTEHFETVTRIDPGFEMAYDFGALVISQEGEDPEAGICLLKRGMSVLPDSWLLPFETGFVYYVCLGDASRAARYFERSAEKEGAPPYVKHFAAFSNVKAGRDDVARSFWEAIREETDRELIRRLAEDALRRLDEREERNRTRRSVSERTPAPQGGRA